MSLAELLAPVWAELGSIKKRLPSVSPATVTSVDPIRIQVDGQTAPVAASPDTLVPVGPGDRVRVLRYGTTHLVLGRVNTKGTPYWEAVGSAAVELNNSNNGTVETPLGGKFTVAPRLFASIHSDTTQYTISGCYASDPDLGRINVRRIDGDDVTVSLTVRWHAIQMTPTSADG